MRHRHKTAHGDHTKPDLPITPMLDMSFQLLAFFIVTFKPATAEGQLALMLPKSGADTPALTAPSTELDPDSQEQYIVRVQARPSGQISGLELVMPKVVDPILFETDTSKLAIELKRRADEKRANKEPVPKLEYQFGDKLGYELVIKLLDEAKQAGYDKVTPNLLVPEKPKAKTP
jgi:biopolymer transport protein ExbD